MRIFVTAVGIVLVVSFLCSIFESVLLSITRPHIEVLTLDGHRTGAPLTSFKANMGVMGCRGMSILVMAHNSP